MKGAPIRTRPASRAGRTSARPARCDAPAGCVDDHRRLPARPRPASSRSKSAKAGSPAGAFVSRHARRDRTRDSYIRSATAALGATLSSFLCCFSFCLLTCCCWFLSFAFLLPRSPMSAPLQRKRILVAGRSVVPITSSLGSSRCSPIHGGYTAGSARAVHERTLALVQATIRRPSAPCAAAQREEHTGERVVALGAACAMWNSISPRLPVLSSAHGGSTGRAARPRAAPPGS